jgi:predicted porin
MKKFMKTTIVVASMAAMSSYASENYGDTKVNFYGVLDMGVLSVDALGSAGNQKSLGIQSGIMTTSQLGIIGTSQISAGHTLGFKFEGGAGMNDGSQVNLATNGAQNTLFSREASMSYSGAIGTITVGRQKNPFAQTFIAGDARNWANIGTGNILFSDSSSFGGSATLKTGVGTLNGGTFTSNLIKYDSPTWKGFSTTAYMAPGGYADNYDYGTAYGLNVKYNMDGVNVVAGTRQSYDKSTGAKTADAQALGGSYTFGKFKVGAGYGNMKNPSVASTTANSSFSLQELTGAYNASANLELSVGQYVLKDKVNTANQATITGVGAIYSLSKATRLYAQYATSENKGGMGMAAYGYGYANINSLAGSQANFPSVMSAAGKTQTAIAVGIQHRF